MRNRIRLLGSESGFTLVETISVMLIMGFLLASAAVGLSVFIGKFREITRWVELQDEAFQALQTIKLGIDVGDAMNQAYFGVSGARFLELQSSGYTGGRKLICRMPSEDAGHANDRVEFFYDGTVIKAYVVWGPTSSTRVIFPNVKLQEHIKIEKFNIVEKNLGGELKAVTVELSARVQTSKDRTRRVDYSTVMAIR
ncbi:MAG: type II secretion system protein [Candidatus Cloacimonadaceae bacterium]|nr:type II secretion system protein [Candidatus Cloacimonadaceae bacterium]